MAGKSKLCTCEQNIREQTHPAYIRSFLSVIVQLSSPFFFSEGVEGEWFLTSYPIGCPTTSSSLSPTLQYFTHTSWGVVEDSKEWHIKQPP